MKIPKQIGVFNKHILNPLLGRVARSGRGPFAIIRHVGRKSGRTYETTVIVVPVTGGFVLALTYGREVDWFRNVQAAGGCVVVWHGREYLIERVEPLDATGGRALFPQPERTILTLIGIEDYVKLNFTGASL